MRHHFGGRARDGYGAVQIAKSISIYYTGTTNAAPIYTTYTGGVPVTAAPQLVTDTEGYFQFYVSDTEILPTILFDIYCQGITYDRIDIFKGGWFNPKKYFIL